MKLPKYIDIEKAKEYVNLSNEAFISLKGFYIISKEVPAADVEPVIHSSWEEIKDSPYDIFDYHFKCRKCHGETPQKAYVIAPDYCPNCGAIMDGNI